MADVAVDKKALIEGERPIFNASYGKLMMWFFLVSDAFTFSALLITYGALRIRSTTEFGAQAWANPEAVFTHTPFLYEIFHIEAPLVFVGIMTFILILSSVTMVLAVEAGHRKSKNEVAKWVLATIIGGATFLGCQAYEWYHFIHGFDQKGVVISVESPALAHLSAGELEGAYYEGHGDHGHSHGEHTKQVKAFEMLNTDGELIGYRLSNGIPIRETKAVATITELASHEENLTHGGANLQASEYGHKSFAALFFFVTGFHGTHVFSGVILLIVLYVNVVKGTYERRGHYEMTEKIGLYWHFVDLVWVFVFTLFYLI
ncbi:cytochrome c oxidase subunit 3 [Pontibacter sp. G13]|uniref:cytochrome c oxidase subunit 3 n=1 Tax=Pontibacter sp. G13 TaxID=3074898 RepID=UPI00288AFF12|nr:cytochrome c oxidase subunit 3 [Pontibacter sp. G13]WNJ16609.1 cytochrome c oxidase subunit 3 [Pontibacter sp. G13]